MNLPVIDLVDLSARGLVVVQPLAHGVHQGVPQQGGRGTLGSGSKFLDYIENL